MIRAGHCPAHQEHRWGLTLLGRTGLENCSSVTP
eukprot:CAMPEP_0185540616 /NCGR_PEP_ID=MMETSP1381-20130426/1416_1 /TAXON_ID=298111 /ORGANISM="Pavlova sp., Strain CCMP459" /LENGTH=33 /DNA_ID= /DNA_START= /DNA_END= /DNA_ORIENTATION=